MYVNLNPNLKSEKKTPLEGDIPSTINPMPTSSIRTVFEVSFLCHISFKNEKKNPSEITICSIPRIRCLNRI